MDCIIIGILPILWPLGHFVIAFVVYTSTWLTKKKKKEYRQTYFEFKKKNLNWLHTTVKPEPPTLFVRYFFRDAMFNDTCKTAALA